MLGEEPVKTPIQDVIQYIDELQPYTHDGHKLTLAEAKFINCYLATNNGLQSAIEAGYKQCSARQYAYKLLNKDYIASEIKYQLQRIQDASIADATEILQYFTSVMRGELKDQFGLEASLGERTKAAQELARRKIDTPQRVDGDGAPQVKITLDWTRPTTTPNVTVNEVSDDE